MSWMKGFAVVTGLAISLSVIASTGASAMPVGAATQGSDPMVVPATAKMTPEQKMKAKQCSMEANAKKLHGDERFKYRAECMKK